MKRFVISALCFAPFAVFAATLTCTIHPAKDTPPATFAGLAKISMAEARKTTLAHVKAASAEIVSAELEIEQGCLVYSFDIRLSGKSGVEETMVDAGTGRIVSQKHESIKQEAAEQAKDKAASNKAK